MEKKIVKSNEEIKKRVIVSSSGDIQEFDEHISTMGSAKISGGKTHKSLRVSGSGKINGDLECNGLTSSGTLTGSGNLTSHGDISSSGSFSIAGILSGDESADFSGSTQIGNLVSIQGNLIASGSFEAGHFVRGEQGIQLSGSSEINGNLSSEKNIRIDGSTYIEGNVVSEDVLFGTSENVKKRQHYRIHGSILAKNKVDVTRTHVEGDIKGKEITLGKGSEVLGNVYYVDKIEMDKKVKLANEPIQIKLDEL
jgi:cytoskeletal protein CcmA (bactofilin family)